MTLFRRLSAELVAPPILERPINTYEGGELEDIVLRRISSEVRWSGHLPPRARNVPITFNPGKDCTLLLEGGRWLLLNSPLRDCRRVYAYDLDSSFSQEPQCIIDLGEGSGEPEQHWLMAADVDPEESQLTFNLCLIPRFTLEQYPAPSVYVPPADIHIYRLTLNGHGGEAMLMANKIKTLRNGFRAASAKSDLRGRYLARSLRVLEPTSSNLVKASNINQNPAEKDNPGTRRSTRGTNDASDVLMPDSPSVSSGVNSARSGRDYLKSRQMMVPPGVEITPAILATVLFQISEYNGKREVIRDCARAVAYLAEEMESTAMAGITREVLVDQMEYITDELKDMTEHIKTSVQVEVATNMAKTMKPLAAEMIKAAVAAALAAVAAVTAARPLPPTPTGPTPTPTPYRDSLNHGLGKQNATTDPRIVAREGIKARQFLLDFPPAATIHNKSQTEILRACNEALAGMATEGSVSHKLRSVERMTNKGLLGEFLTDPGAEWFHSANNANIFITALGAIGDGGLLKQRTYNTIAYFVPVEFTPYDQVHLDELAQVNSIPMDSIAKMRWAKPIARRNPDLHQRFAHLILSFQSVDIANTAIAQGLVICGKRVQIRKCKKEPIRCHKCHGWNHMARECINKDTCGTCSSKTHRTEQCNDRTKLRCTPCGEKGDGHTSWDQRCPTFLAKCTAFDTTHPENKLPFFPASQAWTWSAEYPPPPIRHGDGSLRLPPNEIPRVPKPPGALRQTQLTFDHDPETQTNTVTPASEGTQPLHSQDNQTKGPTPPIANA
jgi:hypothetical protein